MLLRMLSSSTVGPGSSDKTFVRRPLVDRRYQISPKREVKLLLLNFSGGNSSVISITKVSNFSP